MGIKRRDFIQAAGLTALTAAASTAASAAGITGRPGKNGFGQKYGTSHTQKPFDPLNEQGIHPILMSDHPYTFIDSCMQIWPDASFADAHRYGVTCLTLTAWNPHDTFDKALEGLMFWHFIARKYPHLPIVYSVADITRAKEQKNSALLLASQCGDFIGYELHRIEAFYRLGLRLLIPAYSLSNHICGGCLDVTDGGLTSFGREVVKECNRVGLLLDCSHLGRRSSLDIIERSRNPVVFSHSCTKVVADNPRNIDDTQIKSCAAGGGIIGLSPWGPMVLKTGKKKRPTVDDFIDHIDHTAQLLGSVDHIGIGTDMSLGTYPDHEHDPWGGPVYKDVTGTYDTHITNNIRSPQRMVDGFSFYAEVLNFADRLKARGYREPDIHKILGGNYLRVFTKVWE